MKKRSFLRASILGLAGSLFLLVGASSAWAATCNVTSITSPSAQNIRGTVTISWTVNNTNHCSGATVQIVKPASVGGQTITLGTFTLPTTSTTWVTTSGSYPDANSYTIRITPVASSGNNPGNPFIALKNVDNTAPVIAFGVQTPAANANGWNNSDVTLSWTCSDATTGPVSGSISHTLTGSGAGLSHTATCQDLAGNTASDTRSGIDIDRVAPGAALASRLPAANTNGWNNSTVTVTWNCTDALSGPASASVSSSVFTQGAGQTATNQCADLAGNTTSVSQGDISIDTAAPSLSLDVQAPECQSPLWCNDASATVIPDASDGLSGLASAPVAEVVSAEGSHLVEISATDLAGNTTTRSATVQLDRTAPTVGATVDPAGCEAPGWCNALTADISISASDDASGLVTDPSGPDNVSLEGVTERTYVAIDAAGNQASATVTVQIDRTAPDLSLSIDDDACEAPSWCNAGDATVTPDASDSGSGLISQPSPQTVSAEGVTEVTVDVEDLAGNTASASLTVQIDRTAPDLSLSIDDDACEAPSWCNAGDATVTPDASDTGSGLVSQPTAETVSSEGVTLVTVDVEDLAGNTASASLTVQIDRTAPDLTTQVEPAGCEAPSWCNAASATVGPIATDGGSGIADLSTAEIVSAEGSFEVEVSATDLAGNVATASATVQLDRTAPDLSLSIDDDACEAPSWCNADDATVTPDASDSGSGLVSQPSPQTVSAEGVTEVTVDVEDLAGNTASASMTVQMDRTAPDLAATVDPADCEAPSWCDVEEATITVDVSDGGSGLVEDPTTVDTVSAEGVTERTYTATDAAGNSSSVSVTVQLDRTGAVATIGATDPILVSALGADTISGTAVDLHAGVGGVTVRFAPLVGDAIERDATCECGGTAASWSVSTEGLLPGVYEVTAVATDVLGNEGARSLPVTLIIG